ncbi:hypothetical protein M9H77_16913 [Catharanthus roseus]|uniref:Uncharacterized protein n=1 Tax=Catharanthus roseus TaxID=4058 RepID=A0ACC0B334_CATRO|nr:hypothetical protein M9H77_16913 [Catharanthus roseus]
MGSDVLHDQDKDGIGAKDERPIKGFVATGPRCGIIGTPLRVKPSLNETRGTGLREREDESREALGFKKNLTERFSRKKYLEELHKHQKGEKKREYVDFHSTRFWEKFHKIQRKAEEDDVVSVTGMLNDLQLMAIKASGVSCNCLHGVGSEAAHFIFESGRAAAGLASYCLDHEQWRMRRVEDVVPRIPAIFD